MKKNTIDMNYNELENLLDSLLKEAGFPNKIEYRSNKIIYPRRSKFLIMTKALLRLIDAEAFYMTYIRKRLNSLKKNKEIYNSLKKTGCIKSLRTYLHLSKIGLSDLMTHLGGSFDDKLFANFAIATMLYDASFDVSSCRKYLKYFDAFIMYSDKIESKDEFLVLFKESVDYLRNALDNQTFNAFRNYVKIENVSQLMSIYQLSDKKVSEDNLFKITFAKGGIAGLALIHIMAPKIKEKERKAIYELGAVLQLMDDISDIEEDLKSGIQTLPNQKLLNYQELKQMYQGTINNLIEKCNIDPNHVNSTLDMLCWFADSFMEKRYRSLIEAP